MRIINQIVIHCSDTPAGMDIGAREIRGWHTSPPPAGNGWADIGYHYVIRRSGLIERGRPDEVVGAHVQGHNANSIGVCIVGGGHGFANFTWQQWGVLRGLITQLLCRYPDAAVCGHRDLNPGKACPSFDARAWWNFNEGPEVK
jgi:N-acetylmuramoyl-L-alanine amidase